MSTPLVIRLLIWSITFTFIYMSDIPSNILAGTSHLHRTSSTQNIIYTEHLYLHRTSLSSQNISIYTGHRISHLHRTCPSTQNIPIYITSSTQYTICTEHHLHRTSPSQNIPIYTEHPHIHRTSYTQNIIYT